MTEKRLRLALLISARSEFPQDPSGKHPSGAAGEREVSSLTRTLYVGNLPWTTTEADLATFFGAAGTVKSSRIITDRESGRSRGFGFVEVNDEDVERFIAEFNGKNLGGREIVVNEAKPRQAKF